MKFVTWVLGRVDNVASTAERLFRFCAFTDAPIYGRRVFCVGTYGICNSVRARSGGRGCEKRYLHRSRHTKPELAVRSLIHSLGFRFRLHYKRLIGKPDVVLPRHKKIVLIHGCFWHMHDCKRGNVTPQTNADYWQKKRLRNIERDKQNLEIYGAAGFKVLTVWECEIADKEALTCKIKLFLSN